MVVLIGSTALAVDIGQLTDKNRDLQAVADVVALDAARVIDGRTLSEVSGPVSAAANASAVRNDFPAGQLGIELGRKVGNADFEVVTAPNFVPNAVRITANDTVDWAFAPGARDTNRRATAVQEATVGFSVGSFLAGVDTRGNAILDIIFLNSFGANATVLGYDGLVGSNVTLERLGLNFPLGVLSPTELLTTSISARDLLLASAAALPQDGSQTAAINVLNTMAIGASTTNNIVLGDFLIVDQPGGDSAAQAQLDVLSILTSSAFLVDGTHAFTLPASTVDIAGIGNVVIDLSVIEGPKTRLNARVGDSLDTAQVELTVTPTINVSTGGDPQVNACTLSGLVAGLLSLSLSETSTCLLGGFVGRLIEIELNATVPIELKAAGAEVTLTDIACRAPQFITLDPAPMPVKLVTSVNAELNGRLKRLNGTTLANLGPILSVNATGGTVTNATAPPQDFLHPSEFGVPRRVGSSPLGLADLTTFQATDVTLLNSDLTASFSLLTGPASTLVNNALGPLDSLLIGPLNNVLGLNVGGADLTALSDSLKCGALRLAE
jgi:uncharacterized membrane protein